MESLVTELNVLLKLLDHETLSSATEEKKTAVRNLLRQLQPSVNGTDYMYMNTSAYRNGTSFVESLFEEFDCGLRSFKDSAEEQKAPGEEEEVPQTPLPKSVEEEKGEGSFLLIGHSHSFLFADWSGGFVFPPQSPADTPPPLPTTPPPEDYYEEAVPLGPGKMPQYITTRGNSSPPNSIEDGYYEDADNNYPTTRINGQRKNSYNDSDALSSSYESYDEEDEETKAQRLTHQWPSEENSMGLAKDCRICAFLLRKKRFGQWAKQLTLIRQNRLQCYKSSRDRRPSTDVLLSLCSVSYLPKDGRRKKHELRFALPAGETLVLAVQSKEQAEGWLRVIREVSGQSSVSTGPDSSTSPVIQRRTEHPDKKQSADKHTSDSDSVAAGDSVSPSNSRETREGKVKRGGLSELTESVSRAAGRKITRIISFSKKKPPLPGDPRTPLPEDQDPRCGYLSVLVNQVWRERWCCVRRGTLFFHRDRGDLRTHTSAVALQGCEVVPGLGPKHPFAFRILRGGNEVAALEASCSEQMGRWLGVLLAETGSAVDPESLHYDYVDVDTITNIRTAARHSFLWATSSGSDSRTYDDVPYESVQAEDQGAEPVTVVKRRSSYSSGDTEKQQVSVTRHGSNANLYGRYGRTRAEEDARRGLQEKEALERERDAVRNHLLLLRKERREAKEELKSTAVGKQHRALEERISQLEERCREKETQRVELELKLSTVKENLRKCLTGGAGGVPGESRSPSKVKGRKYSGHYGDTQLPVNCASEIRKRPLSIYASTKGTVMRRTKEWESKKGT
ncbi:actin filament-associated protein 1-like 1 isoform X2 [Conger conger]|uniref:actin filament-associated protein 1-like 1 isoform X2 n=1 Tax=Conger conger TaxID=82655 RepID=UPI002A5982F6|nr:actin filament-associated protein 1-like 1 isoform X2 [Conger conger]